MADHSAKIAEIQNLLRAGARNVSVDGVNVTYDFDELRRQLRLLMAEDDSLRGRRPLVGRIDLSRAFE